MDIDRRRHARYERADLELSVARPGIKGMLSLKPTSECLNFSLAGLQFGSDKMFNKGEHLILDLRVYDIEADELLAEVVNTVSHDDGTFCTGVRFCFEEKRMQRSAISHALLQIENRLRLAEEFPATSSFTLDS